ncbi:unnamed protein product [Peniophora sp. CBMAI 1063]|nr:unnamed protein product [Peniophora sp. CBMAI 1063]
MAPTPTRVAIVGAGASGMSAAYALSRHPEKYRVTVFDKQPFPGGMATSLDIDANKYGASYINDGVQGCSPQFANTIRMFRELGFNASPVGMQISFSKGEDFWSNVFPSPLTEQFQKDIKKFGKVLGIIKKTEVLFAFVPVHAMLRMFRFSNDFGEKMVYPLVALFFGTGNQTPYISCAILERVFKDPSMKLFEFSDKSLLASIPTMYAFPKLRDVYTTWQRATESTSAVSFLLGYEVSGILSRKTNAVTLEYKSPDSDSLTRETFDELILACDADTSLKLLGKEASWMERRVLGSVKYLYDVTITHDDLAYMKRHYEVQFDESLAAESAPEDQVQFAKDKFRPLYYTKQYPQDRSKIEMSFDLTHYQPQFRGERPAGPEDKDVRLPRESGASESTAADHVAREAQNDKLGEQGSDVRTGKDDEQRSEPPLDRHVFQTIFLDRDGSSHLWTEGEIPEEHRIYEKWWKQQSHRWQHYAKVVPWMMFINMKHHTQYAGAWSVLNMHELAVTSGFSAAYRLGAEFPFKGDEECERLFKLYLALSHGSRLRKEDRKGFFG